MCKSYLRRCAASAEPHPWRHPGISRASLLAPAFSKRLDMLSSPISKDPCSGVRKYLERSKPRVARGHAEHPGTTDGTT